MARAAGCWDATRRWSNPHGAGRSHKCSLVGDRPDYEPDAEIQFQSPPSPHQAAEGRPQALSLDEMMALGGKASDAAVREFTPYGIPSTWFPR